MTKKSDKKSHTPDKEEVIAEMPGLIITRMNNETSHTAATSEETEPSAPEPFRPAFRPPVVDNETRQKYGYIATEIHRLTRQSNNLQRFRDKVKEFVRYFRTKRRESVIRLLKQYSIDELTYPPESDNLMDAPNFLDLPDCKWDPETWYVRDLLEGNFIQGVWRERDNLDYIGMAREYGPLPFRLSPEESLLLAYTCLVSLCVFYLPSVGPSILPDDQFDGFDNGYELGWVNAVRRYYCEYGRNPLSDLNYFMDVVKEDLAKYPGQPKGKGETDNSKKNQHPSKGERRSAPMSLTEIAVRLKIEKRTAKKYLANYDLRKESFKTWTVRLDLMDELTRQKIDIGR
jgi:hypothetical protein